MLCVGMGLVKYESSCCMKSTAKIIIALSSGASLAMALRQHASCDKHIRLNSTKRQDNGSCTVRNRRWVMVRHLVGYCSGLLRDTGDRPIGVCLIETTGWFEDLTTDLKRGSSNRMEKAGDSREGTIAVLNSIILE